MIILHPFPRNQELSKDLDNNVKSKYFEQIENGIYVRMAILTILFN